MAMRPWLIVVAMLLCPLVALAHEVRPAYLQIRQNGPDTYDVLWKVPGRGDGMRLGLYVELPNDCVRLGAARPTFVDNAYTERWSVKRAGGLTGAAIHIAGLEPLRRQVRAQSSIDATDHFLMPPARRGTHE